GVHADATARLVHERLAIVDPLGGAQPLLSADGGLALAVNGEIYNHRELEQALGDGYAFQSGSDCEVINALYAAGIAGSDDASAGAEAEQGDDTTDADGVGAWLSRLNGIFAFALWDAARGRAIIARDPIGVCPLYWGHDGDGRLWLASEMKALARSCADVAAFPPGHWYDTATGELRRYYRKPWRERAATRGRRVEPTALREAFEAAVHRQMMAD